MKKVRAIPAPRQDDSRFVILGVVLWEESITLHAVVESDAEEIESEFQEGDQGTMFQITDDLGNEYVGRGGGGSGSSDLHVTDWRIGFTPGVPANATKLTVAIWVRGDIDSRVEISL